MSNNSNLPFLLAVWIAVFALILVIRLRRKVAGSGLVFGYLFHLWAIHWLVAFVYLLPWYDYQWNALWYRNFTPQWVETGFRESTYGVLAFAFGSLLVAPFLYDVLQHRRRPSQRIPDPRLPRAYIITGFVFYFVLSRLWGRLSTLSALTSSGLNLMVVGVALSLWHSWREGNKKRFYRELGLGLLCFPSLTLITQGFLSYGSLALITVLAFVGGFYKPIWKLIAVSILVGYLGLSFYIIYMRDREMLRDVIWGGQSMLKRVERICKTISSFELLDIHNQKHLELIDSRLNQNLLVGAAVGNLSQSKKYVYGETILSAVFALIPRALWYNKPILAGGNELATRYTGFPFSENTSVGIGQVMEFYINFGRAGVCIGFLVMGVIVTLFDSFARDNLLRGDWQTYAVWMLSGVSLLLVGGVLVETTASAGAALVTMTVVNKLLKRFRGWRVKP